MNGVGRASWRALLASGAFALSALMASLACAQDNVMLVLDQSGSMWGQIKGQSKLEIARSAVASLVQNWKPEDQLGLVAYGHRRKGDCADIETVLPYGKVDSSQFIKRVNSLQALGMTPLSQAVIHAAEALKLSEQKATVILISDGEETCKLDPCQVGKDLEKRGVAFTAHVIGFDVPNPAHQAQLRCLAENTGGRYFNARDARELSGALSAVATISTEAALPAATASLTAPAQASALSELAVQWTGPADAGDYVVLAGPSTTPQTEWDYFLVEKTKPVASLRMPAVAGSYELRYVSPRRSPATLAKRPLILTPVVAKVEAPAEAMAGASLAVNASGPLGDAHWIGFAPKGSPASSYLHYVRPVAGQNRYTLNVPAQAGEYEVRYVLNESELIAASAPVRVVKSAAQVKAPAQALTGELITVEATGPVAEGNWVGIAEQSAPASAYFDYVYAEQASASYQLKVPANSGAYEIRFIAKEGEKILARQVLQVNDAPVTLIAPATATPGSRIKVKASGPYSEAHWIGFAPKGSDAGSYLDYARPTGATSEIELSAPEEAGDYEIRFVLYESLRVLKSHAIRVQ